MFACMVILINQTKICRNLEHSTILFESKDASPLVRCAWNQLDPKYIACFGLDSSQLFVIDVRSPAVPACQLSKLSNVSCCRWSLDSSSILYTGGTQCVCLDCNYLINTKTNRRSSGWVLGFGGDDRPSQIRFENRHPGPTDYRVDRTEEEDGRIDECRLDCHLTFYF